MFKAAFITDLHFGIRANSEVFLKNITDYLYNEFIPALIENKISHVFIGGDIFDSRQVINVRTFNAVYDFFQTLSDKGFKVVVIAGNHDLYFSTSNDYTSLTFLNKFTNVTFIRKGIQRVEFDGTKIAFIPWITNMEKFMDDFDLISKVTDCKVCIGHFEFIGFRMNKAKVMTEGMSDTALTATYKTIISGHYHMRNEKETNGTKVMYTGTPYQLTRADAGEERGFCILTFEGDYLSNCTYINNKNCIRFETVKFPEEFTEAQIKNNAIDILVNYADKFDEHALDNYKKKIESYGPAFKPEIKLIGSNQTGNQTELTDFAVQSTIDLINEFIDGANIEEKEKVRKEILSLYNQVKISE